MYLFAECQSRHSAKFSKCRVSGLLLSALQYISECSKLTLGEACFCRVLASWHSANNNGNGRGKMGTFVATVCAGHVIEFAECRLWGTRQRSICRVTPCRHSANKSSPHRNGHLRVGAVHVTVFTECQLTGTRQSVSLPSANWPALGKEIFRRVPVVRRVHVVWHSANSSFAECSRFCTRQRTWHSAYVGFPVANG